MEEGASDREWLSRYCQMRKAMVDKIGCIRGERILEVTLIWLIGMNLQPKW